MNRARAALSATAVLLAATAVAGCGSKAATTTSTAPADHKVVLVTHDSFDLPKALLKRFEKSSGIDVQLTTSGDAGELASKLQVTKDDPLGDAAYGIDTTFQAAVTGAGVIDGDLSPIDVGYVCVNVDDAWFTSHHQAPPTSLDDLVKPAYKDLFVTEGATTSSPGMAFLLATIGTYGDGWQDYWRQLVANGAKVDSGWTQAFEKDYSASGGDRPVVVSYNTDPSYGVKNGQPSTHALLNTCFADTEYAGVLTGAKNPTDAQKVVAWLQSAAVQKALPTSMYVYPTRAGTPLPGSWKRFAPVPGKPIEVSASDIAANRRDWTTTWTDIVSG
ncbi:MAG TPA: thiamine ABC transporter substrate-binding protein [Nocardioides sp.]|nr:thiamine ABC transporter substrate-binding protein [Nocardioides sp.]